MTDLEKIAQEIEAELEAEFKQDFIDFFKKRTDNFEPKDAVFIAFEFSTSYARKFTTLLLERLSI